MCYNLQLMIVRHTEGNVFVFVRMDYSIDRHHRMDGIVPVSPKSVGVGLDIFMFQSILSVNACAMCSSDTLKSAKKVKLNRTILPLCLMLNVTKFHH